MTGREVRYTALTRTGRGTGGRITVRSVAEFVRAGFDRGWKKCVVTTVDGTTEIGRIGVVDGVRTWWADR